MSKKTFFAVIIVIFCLVVMSSLNKAQAAASEPINIGIVTSLTGPASHLAADQVNGAALAVKEINKQGGLLGRQVQLLVRDDEFRPDVGIRKFDELVQVNKITALFGGVSGSVSLAISEKASQHHIPHSGVTTLRGNQKPGKFPYMWGWQTDALVGMAGAEYAVKNLGKKHYILYADYVLGQDLTYSWEKGVKKFGGELLGKSAVPLGAKDYAPYFTKVLAAKPDVLVLNNWALDSINAVKQAAEFGLKDKMKIFVALTNGGSTEKAIGSTAMEGVYCGVSFYWEAEKFHPSAKKFVAAYQAEKGQKPSAYVYNCYAGVLAWADAVKIAKSTKGEDVLKVWGSPSFSFDYGKGKVKWRTPDLSAYEEWYICKGRSAAAVAAEPDRILDIVNVTQGTDQYLHTLQELGYK